MTGVLAGLVRGARPRQWVKSVLVPAAPAAAGVLGQTRVLEQTAVAVVAFTMAAAGTYLINDAMDAEQDRRHPVKMLRPVASGQVPVPVAAATGVALMVAAVVGGGLLAERQLAVVLGAYVVLTLCYSAWLKHVPVVELLVVAAGFLLRAIAGGAATGVALSEWFLIVASFGSLYMVVGKRYAEVVALGAGASSHRKALAAYPATFLRQIREVCVSVTLLAYCLFAFERSLGHAGPPWYQLSIVPVTLGLFQYALLLERGQGGEPEDVVLRDRPLQIYGALWAVLFFLGVAAG